MATAAALVVMLERRRRARHYRERWPRHTARNLVVAGVAAATVRLVETPLVMPVAAFVERRGWGLTRVLGGPQWLRAIVAVLLLDYTLYVWHILLHRVPLLWRFHLTHHIDLDLDASTALRFHTGEFLASIPWRAAQIATIGVAPRALALWRTLTAIEVAFHHSNLRLPLGIERVLARLIVTPRLHGIHHSIVADERDSNFASGLTLWDALHRTLRSDVSQRSITIGVPPYREARQVTLLKSLAVPFADDP